MIFSMGRTTVSGLNFDPSFFLNFKKGEQSPFFAPSIDRSGTLLYPSSYYSFPLLESYFNFFYAIMNVTELSGSFRFIYEFAQQRIKERLMILSILRKKQKRRQLFPFLN